MSDWIILLLFLVIISLARALFKKKAGKEGYRGRPLDYWLTIAYDLPLVSG